MQEVVIVGAARTPFGLYLGALADQRCQDLAAASMKEAINRAGIDSSKVDGSIFSEAMQTSLPANVGRHGWLLAGLDENPAGYTMNCLCAGALQTAISAFNKIAGGEYGGFLVGGVETNSQAPYYIRHPRYKFGPGNLCFHDQKVEVQTNAQPVETYGELTAASIADIIARNYGLSRVSLDEYALADKAKAQKAAKDGKAAILAIVKKGKKSDITIDTDEAVKATTLEKLMSLPAINECSTATTGNMPALADGAASLVMLSADRAKELGSKPLAKLIGFGITAGNPGLPEKIAVRSLEKALKFSGLDLAKMDYIDIHEPSAAFAMAVANLLGADAKGKINVDGGTIAFGHAGAATGGALMVNMIYRLQRTGAKYGLVNVAALGGQAISVIFEKM
ncbi:MAG: thiolase family protein [Syntrophales bacterium]|nr:thiolase family protein [Syntrophales bacterium]